MRSELDLLYGDVVAGELSSPEEFRLRLEEIQSLDPDSGLELNVRRAVQAVSALKHEAPSRHHQLELLQDALGIA
jgi:hypothetical protein